jgi:hypothetical protein
VTGILRVGNCSGFYGDRLSAMREMLEGGDLDVLTGDYLAELTMLILGKDRMKDPDLGYARTFLKQAEDCLGLALEKRVKIVTNAGGLNPVGLAEKVGEAATRLGLDAKVAAVHGDDLIARAGELGFTGALTANAYLGAHAIAEALRQGADVVVTGRVTDASVVVGPAIAHFDWDPANLDALAGAVVAGHVIECGTQATGGNFSGFRAMRPDLRPLGFPIAEIAADGSSVITKHEGTGGAVTVDTVTAQLVYEIQSQRYLGPDVTTRLDSIDLTQEGPDRVRISGVTGEPAPEQLKVCVNELGGFRNSAEFILVGLDIEAKADWVHMQVDDAFARGAGAPADVTWSLARTDHEDASTEEAASARLRITVRDQDPSKVGKGFTAPLVELALASYPGFTLSAVPGPGTPYGVYRAGYVDRAAITPLLTFVGGASTAFDDPAALVATGGRDEPEAMPRPDAKVHGKGIWLTDTVPAQSDGPTRRVALGRIAHARSGDKGGDANIGIWADRSKHGGDRVVWLLNHMTPDRIRQLLPEAEALDVDVYRLPRLGAVNVVIRGLLGEGVAASSRFDPQAKALGEWLRSRHVDIPEVLL